MEDLLVLTIKEKLQMPGWKSFIRDCVLTQAENLNLVRICYYGGEIKTLTNNHSVHSSYTSNGLRTENNEWSDQFVLGLYLASASIYVDSSQTPQASASTIECVSISDLCATVSEAFVNGGEYFSTNSFKVSSLHFLSCTSQSGRDGVWIAVDSLIRLINYSEWKSVITNEGYDASLDGYYVGFVSTLSSSDASDQMCLKYTTFENCTYGSTSALRSVYNTALCRISNILFPSSTEPKTWVYHLWRYKKCRR